MIGHLTGVILRTDVVDVGGVGYDVKCPEVYPVGTEVSLYVTSVWGRDGGLSLYGFSTVEDQEMFRALCRVTRVGAEVALSLLRSHGAGGTAEKVRSNDAAGLAKAPKVGRKTAEHIIALVVLPEGAIGGARKSQDVLVEALVGLGYDESAAERAVSAARAEGTSEDEGDLLKSALAHVRGG
jgi:Holliday junction DNA helicase RuvA